MIKLCKQWLVFTNLFIQWEEGRGLEFLEREGGL